MILYACVFVSKQKFVYQAEDGIGGLERCIRVGDMYEWLKRGS